MLVELARMRGAGYLLPCLAALFAARMALCVSLEEELVAPVRLESPEEHGKVRYRLDAFGLALTLELEHDPSFLARDFSLQYVGRPRFTKEEVADAAGHLADCFYSGSVNGEETSSAALSLCAGMRGAFFYRGEEYFIQPSNHSLSADPPGAGNPLPFHLLSKKSRAKAKCGVTDANPQPLAPEKPRHTRTAPGNPTQA